MSWFWIIQAVNMLRKYVREYGWVQDEDVFLYWDDGPVELNLSSLRDEEVVHILAEEKEVEDIMLWNEQLHDDDEETAYEKWSTIVEGKRFGLGSNHEHEHLVLFGGFLASLEFVFVPMTNALLYVFVCRHIMDLTAKGKMPKGVTKK